MIKFHFSFSWSIRRMRRIFRMVILQMILKHDTRPMRQSPIMPPTTIMLQPLALHSQNPHPTSPFPTKRNHKLNYNHPHHPNPQQNNWKSSSYSNRLEVPSRPMVSPLPISNDYVPRLESNSQYASTPLPHPEDT